MVIKKNATEFFITKSAILTAKPLFIYTYTHMSQMNLMPALLTKSQDNANPGMFLVTF